MADNEQKQTDEVLASLPSAAATRAYMQARLVVGYQKLLSRNPRVCSQVVAAITAARDRNETHVRITDAARESQAGVAAADVAAALVWWLLRADYGVRTTWERVVAKEAGIPSGMRSVLLLDVDWSGSGADDPARGTREKE